MGTLKTTNIESISGSGTVTLGTSGETFALGTGVVQSNMLYPAFFAYDLHTTTQSLSAATPTKLTPATEYYDTDSAYSSDKFTVPSGKAGKYRFYGGAEMVNNDDIGLCTLYVNGSILLSTDSTVYTSITSRFNSGTGTASDETFCSVDFVANLSDSDYVELYMTINDAGDVRKIQFGGYRIGT